MGPPAAILDPTPRGSDAYLMSTIDEPAHILISASFLPDFNVSRNRKVALHLTVQKLNPNSCDLLLQSFQILLVGYTDIKAGTTKSTEMSSHTIQSLSNLGMMVFPACQEVGSIHTIDSALWYSKTLPDFVVPSFDACNVSRRYELEISLGFQCRSAKVRLICSVSRFFVDSDRIKLAGYCLFSYVRMCSSPRAYFLDEE